MTQGTISQFMALLKPQVNLLLPMFIASIFLIYLVLLVLSILNFN